MDSIEVRDWLDTQSEDAVVDYIMSLQTQLTACQQELKAFHKNWSLMKEALEDYQKGILSDIALITVLGGIICPPEITEEDIEWGRKAIVQYEKDKETPNAQR